MKSEQQQTRRTDTCELCNSGTELKAFEVPPAESNATEHMVTLCSKCLAQIKRKEALDSAHWECLSGSMWSEVPAVQVLVWRMLSQLRNESWAVDCLDMLYLDGDTLAWAKASSDHENDGEAVLHKDINGNVLQNGDTVVLTKSLDVKGSTLNAKLGTVVRNIRLVNDNPEQIEGKIEGQTIVILTKYLRKQA